MKCSARPFFSQLRHAARLLAFVLPLGCCLPVLTQADEGFKLQDLLGRNWQNEFVAFPLGGAELTAAKGNLPLVGPDGAAAPYQIVPGSSAGDPDRIAFLADVGSFGSQVYRFGAGVAPAKSDLQVEETDTSIRLTNGRIGLALRKVLRGGEGPIESIRLTSGQWIGNSSLVSPRSLTAYRARVVARGPVFAEVVCQAQFSSTRDWTLTFRLHANEPVVLVQESFSLQDDSRFVFSPNRGFSPDTLFYRAGSGQIGKLSTWTIESGGAEPAFVLEPWLHWAQRERQGPWFGLFNQADPSLLAIGAFGADAWVTPGRAKSQTGSQVLATADTRGFQIGFPLADGCRKWMLISLEKASSLAMLKEKDLLRAPPPQHYLIKHGHFPLNLVKDYVLDWPAQNEDHPRLFLRKQDLPAWRKTFKVDPAMLARCRKSPISAYLEGNHVAYYLATEDDALGVKLATNAVAAIQKTADMYLRQDEICSFGFAPHHQSSLMSAINLADIVMGSKHLSEAQLRRMRAQIAFIGYAINRADYWSPERGFGANPNMTTSVAAYRTAVACMISQHPMARAWLKSGLTELKDVELDTWSDDNGGWLEAPHYAMVSYDHLLGCFLMARNSGLADHLFDPRMKKIAEWLAKISTPPDPRVAGRRHLPPIGNTYLGEPSSVFGTLAYLWKDRDPKFASEMQWMYRQQGSFPNPGIGGFFPTLAGYRDVLLDPGIPATAPSYGSELFPETGVVLRNQYPTDRETMLHLIAGKHYQHYDYDSGSITLWGKGRIVADDFGYYGRAPANDHSMVEAAGLPNLNMRVREFAPAQHLDYLRGELAGWTRQIAFVKDPDPLGPNFFFLSDAVKWLSPPTWRLWLTANAVSVADQSAHAVGKEDVDTDILFLSPSKASPLTEQRTRHCGSGLYPDGRWRGMDSTQTGLIVKLDRIGTCAAIIYPRLKTETPPAMTPLADGRGAKIQTASGTDYVFMSAAPFTFKGDDNVFFEGTVGAAAIRGKAITLSLGAPGKIAAQGESLASDKPAARKAAR